MVYRNDVGIPESHRPSQAPSFLNRLSVVFSWVLRPKAKQGLDQAQFYSDKPSRPPVNASNEEACAKIWSVYVSEAERYDAALVESWKADMEGMLIFSGLFSASLTAFLIESYKTLQPDSGDLTVAAISQVSQQLAAIANGSTFSMQTPPAFHPTSASLLCNALWFISLSLSLTCALLATFVEQWARGFLHKTEMRPSPGRRARVFSFLYFGLKNFRMNTVVDAIPFLLHASLLLFFVGLVVFLLPVNRIMMYIICIVLLAFILLYTVLTILPITHLDSPYWTPLSAPLWSLVRTLEARFSHKDTITTARTVVEAVMDHALHNTADRDQRALAWTLESLTDDHELLPFVEAIPDVIYGPDGFREVNDHLFDRILGSRDVASPLVSRIWKSLESTQAMRGDDPLCVRRRAACWKSLWALCMIPRSSNKYFDLPDVQETSLWLWDMDSTSRPFALLGFRYHEHMWLLHLHSTLRELLYHDLYGHSDSDGQVLSQIQHVLDLMPRTRKNPYLRYIGKITRERIHRITSNLTSHSVPQLKHAYKEIDDVLDLPHWNADLADMVADFIRRCGLTIMNSEDHAQTQLPYSVLPVCARVLSQFRAIPADFQNLGLPNLPLSVNFVALTMRLKSAQPIYLLDDFAQVSLPLLSCMTTQEQTSLFLYLVRRYNHGSNADMVNAFALHRSNHIREMAHVLGNHLQRAHDTPFNGMDLSAVVHTVVVLVQCIRGPDLCNNFTGVNNFIAEIEARVSFPLPAEIVAARSFCNLKALADTLSGHNHLSLSQIETICQHELLSSRCPLFLPKDVDVEVVKNSLHREIAHVYLRSMANLFENFSVSSVWASMRIFDTRELITDWSQVDYETQTLFFKAALKFAGQLETLPVDLVSLVAEPLWRWYPFWAFDRVEETLLPSIDGINLSCLHMLWDTLDFYQKVAGTQTPPVDTVWSRQLVHAIGTVLRQELGETDEAT